MILGIDLSETQEYTLEEDTENPTTWILGCLDGSLLIQIGASSAVVGTFLIDIVRFGLRGWKNFKDKAGNEIPFTTKEVFAYGKKRQAVTDDLIEKLHHEVIRRLGIKIIDANKLTEQERKN